MLSSKILCPPNNISRNEYAILPPTQMSKRETVGNKLRAARLALGWSAETLSDNIKRDFRAEIVSPSTIRSIEADRGPNPGIKTLEFHAKGVGLDPQEVFALMLDDPPDAPEAGYTEGQFALMEKSYKQVRKDRKPFIDELIKIVIDKMNESR